MSKPDFVVPVTNFELLRVLAGNVLNFATLDGRTAEVRLYTPEELMTAQREAAASLGGPDPGMSRAQAEQLTRPIRWRTTRSVMHG